MTHAVAAMAVLAELTEAIEGLFDLCESFDRHGDILRTHEVREMVGEPFDRARALVAAYQSGQQGGQTGQPGGSDCDV